ncbi:coiled-coil domain-containing protein [Spirillospora sp. NBC_01491]|uniref:coiled-coil domain-containing protein n=1 Tax=Spirillospora sp. NBC_01491 TaxID=2976007 RepID=UPI002E313E33|nr:hypothetical protein [Spirillospora sp. NBC_01491]
MAAFYPDDSPPRARRPVPKRRAALALVLGVAALLPSVPGSAATAASAPAEPKKDLKAEYAKLKKRADALSKEYRGELISLEEAKRAAQRAGADAERVGREYETARADVRRIAASTYMTGRLDTIPIVTADDPAAAIRAATMVEHLAGKNDRRVTSLRTLTAEASRSRESAKTKLEAVRKEIDDLEGQRSKVRKLLVKYKPETPAAPSAPGGGGGGGGKPDDVSGAKSPLVGTSMTPRMRTAMLAIDGKFGPFPTIGCSRPGDPQDHGTGTACDFMESTGGNMPSASAKAHGDAVANYVIANASRLGIKYVIWRQRIYDMRGSGAWKAMEDRGSVTQNHFDHVHVSVL